MTNENATPADIDWSLTTWEGARQEQMRRWRELSLAEIILALEEMQILAAKVSPRREAINERQ